MDLKLQREQEIIKKSLIEVVKDVPKTKINHSELPDDFYILMENSLQPYPEMTETAKQYLAIIKSLKHFPVSKINPEIYWFLCKLLVYLERYQTIYDMRNYNLKNQQIRRSKYRKNEFVIEVPGLSEDRPSVRPYDYIIISQSNGSNYDRYLVKHIGEKYVTIHPNPNSQKEFIDDQRYDVAFEYFTWNLDIQEEVLNKVRNKGLFQTIFPVARKCEVPTYAPVSWINKNIINNPEQQQAVRNILLKTARPAPYILFGPPGTGKTSTLVEAITQIHFRNPMDRILICTPSNGAADEIAKRLLDNSISGTSIYRMYSASRNIDDIDDLIKACSNFATNDAIHISKDVLSAKKIIITTLATCYRIHSYQIRKNHFEYLFIDEAGQATEIETLIPILVMAGEREKMIIGQIIIAGDPQQLGPIITSKNAECLLSISMLERIMKLDVYKKVPAIGYDENYVTKLIRNYRSHESILQVPNKLFYDNELIAMGGSHTTRALNWNMLPNKNCPLIFHATFGQEKREPHSPSICNYREITIIIEYVEKLLKTKLGGRKVEEKDIGIVTPYKLQRIKINQALEQKKLTKISVGTVETFQGQERDIIILSTVRTSLVKSGNRIYVGFISNPRRFNVAITRAKALLIVVGNPKILEFDYSWRTFIQYCQDNGACAGSGFIMKKYFDKAAAKRLIGQKHTVQVSSGTALKPLIEEDPKSADNYVKEKEKQEDRLRRLPIGPMPKIQSLSFRKTLSDDSTTFSSDDNFDSSEYYETCYDDDNDHLEFDPDYEDDSEDAPNIESSLGEYDCPISEETESDSDGSMDYVTKRVASLITEYRFPTCDNS